MLQDPSSDTSWFVDAWELWGRSSAKIAGAILVALVAHAILFVILRRVFRKTRWQIDDILVVRLERPARLGLVLLALQAILPTLPLFAPDRVSVVRHLLSLGTVFAVGWTAIALVGAVEEHVKQRFDVNQADNLEARRVHTQVDVLARAIYVFVVFISIAAALMTFPRVRELGASLLASAGIAGLAIGLAARPVLENLIAGIQIAMTQPIRLDDVVIVEGEWGRIEEITSTYVVVRIWDERRLIVPFSRFIQQSFQNWTRTSAEILGTVFVHTDYTVPVPAVREELQRIVESSEKWDRRVCNLQVTGTGEQALELRALVSAKDSGSAWDLRVQVRERLIEFLQREYPGALPRTRVEIPEAGRMDASGFTGEEVS